MVATFIVPEIGLLALEGVLICNLLAMLLKYDSEKVRSGFYGFNGILFGAAIGFFFELTPFVIFLFFIFVVLTFFVSTALEHFLADTFNLPGLSLPFVMSFYVFLIFITNYNSIYYKGISFVEYEALSFIPDIVQTYFKSFALVLFQSSIISGILLTATVLFFSRVMFVNSVLAFVINYYFVHLIFPDVDSDVIILTSFNSILTSFALGGSLIIVSRKSIPLILVSAILIIIFTGFFEKLLIGYLLPVLVLPFNFVVLATIYSLKFRQKQSDLVLLYFKPGSPEENNYYHSMRSKRFDKFRKLFPELPVFGEWTISQGIDGDITHKDDWKYAWDFVIADEKGSEHSAEGIALEDYYCFGAPVASPLNGEVVRVIDNIPDNKIGEVNLKENWGNTVIVDHGEGLYSALSHLKMSSIKVKKGDSVRKGATIAQCGNSGRSPTPHLHFQFQLSDKLGAATYEFPFSHFIEKSNGSFELKTFDYPEQASRVLNVETHKSLKKAFEFQLNEKFNLEYELNGYKLNEKWEVKVDMQNNVYIESNKNAKAYLYAQEKVFYIANFIGNKNSSLYYFYLCASSVPLTFSEKINWTDYFPVYLTINGPAKYLSEIFLILYQPLKSTAQYRYKQRINGNKDFVIQCKLQNSGAGLFKFLNQNGSGELTISYDGFIKEFSFVNNGKEVKAKFKNSEDEQ